MVIVESRMVAGPVFADGEMRRTGRWCRRPRARICVITRSPRVDVGAPWLSAADKQMLAGLRVGMVSVSLIGAVPVTASFPPRSGG